ncbi:hypothetical protein K2X33_13830 [bacterium]|nr:hypothetical protein [bacterium]
MKLHLWGTDFRRSDAEFRANLFISPETRSRALPELLSLGFEDLVYVSTCNRVEFYTTAPDYYQGTRAKWVRLLEHFGLGEEAFYRGYHYEGKSALRHLLRVSTSLESLAVGETQIVGQLKDALALSREVGLPVHPSLEKAFDLALATSRRVRSQTALGEKPISVATLAFRHLQEREEQIPLSHAVVVGRSPISVAAVQWLRKNRPECAVTWVNRTLSALEALPESAGCTLRSLEDFLASPGRFSHLFTSTASREPVFDAAFFERLEAAPAFFFDFAQPPDIRLPVSPPPGWDWCFLEDLAAQAKANQAARGQAVAQAEEFIDEALKGFCREQKQTPLLKEFSAAEPRVLEDLAEALLVLEKECPQAIQPQVKRWAEKLLKQNWHRSREHLRDVLDRVGDLHERLPLV